MSFPSEAQHASAIKAALAATNAAPYDFGVTIPATVTAYNLVSVTDRFGGVLRGSGRIGTRSIRVEIRSVGKAMAISPLDPMKNAREMRLRADLALRGMRLTIGGSISTPILFETSDPIDQDGNVVTFGPWFSGPSFYTYTI